MKTGIVLVELAIGVGLEKGKSALGCLVPELSAHDEGHDSRCGSRKSGLTAAGLVAEAPAIFILTGKDVFGGFFDGGIRDRDASFPGGIECHYVHDRHGEVGVPGFRIVAPTTLCILGSQDDVDRAAQASFQAGIFALAPSL